MCTVKLLYSALSLLLMETYDFCYLSGSRAAKRNERKENVKNNKFRGNLAKEKRENQQLRGKLFIWHSELRQ